MTTLLISETTTSAKTRREKRRTVLGFLIFSTLSIIGCFILDASPLSPLFLIGAFFCAGLAIYAWLSVLKDWTPDEEGEYFGALFFWTVALVISWWLLRLATGWLGIPFWAAVIIVLLIIQIILTLKLFRR